MRSPLDLPKLRAFVEAIGRAAQGPGNVYLVGGSTALLLGIRSQTVDIDLKLDPEPKAIFEEIARLKDRLGVNVELASPDLFFPPLPGWRERSEFIERRGPVAFYHYDFYGQALAKILRGHRHDLADASALANLGKVDIRRLLELFLSVKADLIRYPAVDAVEFERRVRAFVAELERP